MDLRLFIETIAREAGEITLRYYNSRSLEIFTKSDESPVTQADRESEQHLRSRIRERFADDVIIGEEFGTDGSNTRRRWILDPIDGTKSFVHGVPLYGVLIGVEENGIIEHGVIHMPALGEIVSASRGHGCYWNGARCSVSNRTRVEDALVLTTNDRALRTVMPHDAYDAIVGRSQLYRTWGDCYGHLLVATGRADVMLDPKMAIWDAAPLGLIAEEAGGAYMALSGERTIEGGNLVTCNHALAPFVHQVLQEVTHHA